MTTLSLPFFSVVVPVLNEENHIAQVLASLLCQVRGHPAEILVLDGGSHDDTPAIVASIAADNPIVRLVANPGRTQSVACNVAAQLAAPQSRILLRADAHAAYPPNFIFDVVQALESTGATSVVVPMRTVGIGTVQRAIAATQNSRLGNGGSSHRRIGLSRYVDHGHHAAFHIDFFRSLGGYDPTFTHNEDAELDVRAVQAGGRIWLCAEAAIDYFPRGTLGQLARQYLRHGRGRARTTSKHRLRLKVRQCVPLLILMSTILCLLAPIFPWLTVPLISYLTLCMLWGCVEAFRKREFALLLMGPAAAVMHLAWAIGFLDGRFRVLSHKLFFNGCRIQRRHRVDAN